jgi:hypothetical protein
MPCYYIRQISDYATDRRSIMKAMTMLKLGTVFTGALAAGACGDREEKLPPLPKALTIEETQAQMDAAFTQLDKARLITYPASLEDWVEPQGQCTISYQDKFSPLLIVKKDNNQSASFLVNRFMPVECNEIDKVFAVGYTDPFLKRVEELIVPVEEAAEAEKKSVKNQVAKSIKGFGTSIGIEFSDPRP